jgi:GT2 family glycosyltransferase
MIDIYMTCWQRPEFTKKSIDLIHERTTPGTFRLHVFDNGSDAEVQTLLRDYFDRGLLTSIHLDSRNTGCLYNKAVFHAMTESTSEYYVVTDNDVYPPKLEPDWLSELIDIMDSRPDLAFLAPQLPPQFLQEPQDVAGDVVYAKAVGNTLKVVRREAYPFGEYDQLVGKFGDDGKVSELVRQKGWKVAFARNIYCYHAGQCVNWGYEEEDINKDPRKAGYGEPFKYEIENEETYIPKDPRWRI